MFYRPIISAEKDIFNQLVSHPLQSYEWGEFRKLQGVKVERIGLYDQKKLKKAFQVYFHELPKFGRTIGYLPRSYQPDEDQLAIVKQLALKHKSIFVKLEPNVAVDSANVAKLDPIREYLLDNGCKKGRPLFTKYSFLLDLTQSETTILQNLKSKTRYNVNLAQKKGVTIRENSTAQGLKNHLGILAQTRLRQGFYTHSDEYFTQLFDTFKGTKILRIFEAVFENQVLTSWMMLVFGDTLYYPYGASTDAHRDVMASNLMMWEMIRFGKTEGLKVFDMWGALSQNPDPTDPWFGFHRFKSGYNPTHVEYVGTFDLVVDPVFYSIFSILEKARWKILRAKAKIRRLVKK